MYICSPTETKTTELNIEDSTKLVNGNGDVAMHPYSSEELLDNWAPVTKEKENSRGIRLNTAIPCYPYKDSFWLLSINDWKF